ncbi:MAG: MarR family transcriptional regulator [Phycisphaeraceae bacterium]|nr:MarR family transcriptional regulator [Phycisphaerales bacterium]MCB9843193.1 MarR family transcriptional regulator [Phycisphaeraceae bacterium]
MSLPRQSPNAPPACTPADASRHCTDPIVSRICAIHHTLMRVADRVLDPVGLTASRLMLLKRIEHAEHRPTVSWLSEQLSLSTQAVSRMVAALEDDGLVARLTRAGSGRSVFVELTSRGRASLDRASAVLATVSSLIRTDIDDHDQRAIESILDRILDSLHNAESQSTQAEALPT